MSCRLLVAAVSGVLALTASGCRGSEGERREVVPDAATLAVAANDAPPLRGKALAGNTGLRLVVADNPPFVLDVDSGRVTPARGVDALKRGTLSVVSVGGRAAVVVARGAWPQADLYGVRGRLGRASRLGTGADVVPAADGESIWVKSFAAPTRCTLRQLRLDGGVVTPARPFPCRSTIYPGGELGVVMNRTKLLDPRTGRTILNTGWGVIAAAGKMLVLSGPGDSFTLLNAATRETRRVTWPRTIGRLDGPAVDPRGRYVAVAFANPAWEGGQGLDVWLLNLATARLTHLPSMPALVALKQTSMVWMDDGRLVLLSESGGKDVVAVWRPGEARLAIKTVPLPDRSDSGSDSFAPLR
jgi:hypothetical protein